MDPSPVGALAADFGDGSAACPLSLISQPWAFSCTRAPTGSPAQASRYTFTALASSCRESANC
eukprot:498692-Heterocapsa_arctica.AAC.1